MRWKGMSSKAIFLPVFATAFFVSINNVSIHMMKVTDVPDASVVFSKMTSGWHEDLHHADTTAGGVFELIVLVGHDMEEEEKYGEELMRVRKLEGVRRVLDSIARTDFEGDTVHLEVRMERLLASHEDNNHHQQQQPRGNEDASEEYGEEDEDYFVFSQDQQGDVESNDGEKGEGLFEEDVVIQQQRQRRLEAQQQQKQDNDVMYTQLQALIRQCHNPSLSSKKLVRVPIKHSSSAGTGSLASWTKAWRHPTSTHHHNHKNNQALIIDAGIELSPLWYQHVKQASMTYFHNRTDIAGISLMRQSITTSIQAPLRRHAIHSDHHVHTNINTNTNTNHNHNHAPFLHPLVVGPQAFVPHPDRWTEFLQWVHTLHLPTLQTQHPNLVTTLLGPLKPYDHIYFYHTRKAGGTTMRKWINNVVAKHNKTRTATEGWLCSSKYFVNPGEAYQKEKTYLYDDNVLSVTTLRDPVDRILSSYNFEGRWPQHDRKHLPENEISLDTWIAEKLNRRKNKCLRSGYCWTCVSNCYCHWFGGDGTGAFEVSRAYEILQQFDVILYMTDFRNDAYMRSLHRLFDAVDVRYKRERKTKLESYNVTTHHRKKLADLNGEDQELVDHFVGVGRDTRAVQEWYKMIDEALLWKLWTQLFSYWCKVRGLHVLYVNPPGEKALAVVHPERKEGRTAEEEEERRPDFEVLEEHDGFELVHPLQLAKYSLGGQLMELV